MKKSFILLLLVCNISAFLPVKAQEYVPFPTADAEWKTIYVRGNFYNPSNRTTFLYSIGNDTLIEGNAYKQINCNDRYCAALREENKRIYTHLPGYGEHLMYDFNLEVGDTIFYTLSGEYGNNGAVFFPQEHFRIVDSIGEFELKTGDIRRVLYLQAYPGNGDWWIEGMGGVEDFFWPFIFSIPIGAGHPYLICFTQGGNLLHLLPYCDDCACMSSPETLGQELVAGHCKIFPNPATDNCSVHSPEAILHTIAVFDYTGKKIEEISGIYAFETEIKLSGHPSGIYFIQVATALGVVTQKIIKQ